MVREDGEEGVPPGEAGADPGPGYGFEIDQGRRSLSSARFSLTWVPGRKITRGSPRSGTICGTSRSDTIEARRPPARRAVRHAETHMQTTAPRTTKTLNFTDLLTAIAVVATIIGGLLTL